MTKKTENKTQSTVETKKSETSKAIVTAENIKQMDLSAKIKIYGTCLEQEVPAKIEKDQAYEAFRNLMSSNNKSTSESSIEELEVCTTKKASKEDLEKKDFAEKIDSLCNLYRLSSSYNNHDDILIINKAFGPDFSKRVSQLRQDMQITESTKVIDEKATKALQNRAKELYDKYVEADTRYTTILQQKNVIESYVDMCKKISSIK